MYVTSHPGEGSCFTVFLPVRDVEAPTVPESALPLEAEVRDLAEVYRVGESGGMDDKLLVERLINPDNDGANRRSSWSTTIKRCANM